MTEISSETPDDMTAVVTAAVAMPVDDAYRAFIDADRLAQWYWPDRLQASYEVDPRPGGLWRARSDVIGLGFTAVYGDVEPNSRLTMSWQWDGDDAISEVWIGFAPEDDGSRITVRHGRNPNREARDQHLQGWTDCLGRLHAIAPRQSR